MAINKINSVNSCKIYQNAGFKVPSNIDILKNYAPIKKDKQIYKKPFWLITAVIVPCIIAMAAYKNRKNDLIGQIKKSMELELNEKIDRKSLSCIINKKQLMKMLAGLSEENYIASAENIEKGIFMADLHSHTWFSDGWGKVDDIMYAAGKYADNLYAKTGKKFLFSITDHDCIGGVKEALKIISKNPEKFKNLAFVPGVELSFIQHIGNDKFEGAELLAHCINPYSKKLNLFLYNLHTSREKMVKSLIDSANEKLGKNCFSREEMNEYYLKKPNENFAYNLHYRVMNYLQVKNLINKIALEKNQNANDLYSQYMKQWQVNKNFKSVDNFIKFLEQKGIYAKKPNDNDLIYEICKKAFPTIKDNQIKSSSENTFEELINFFSKDKNTILCFAHPVFTFRFFKNKENAINNLISNSKNLIKTTEKYHQAYSNPIKNGVISQNDVDEINAIIDKYNLINLGGRDNHSPQLLGDF